MRGARPRTLAVSVAPVLAGAAAVHTVNLRAGAALVVALGMQAGVNYANDYFDGVRGVDTPSRSGPARLVATGLARPRAVLTAALVSFAAAAAAGVALAAVTSWKLLVVGAFAILAALGYSGGPRPYASMGLAEVMVFVFFGPVATAGTAYAARASIPAHTWWAAVSMGLLAAAVLVCNNLRDIPTDAAAGKRTLAVRLGDRNTRRLYAGLVTAALWVPLFGIINGALPFTTALALASMMWLIPAMRAAAHATGRDLIPPLAKTAIANLVAGAGFAAGFWIANAR